jgi:hypothetical protein
MQQHLPIARPTMFGKTSTGSQMVLNENHLSQKHFLFQAVQGFTRLWCTTQANDPTALILS